MILSAVCTSNLVQAIFLQVVRVLFTALDMCHPLQASLWCPYFWHLKSLRGTRTYSLTLKTIANFHFLGSMGLVKCQDVSVGLDSFFAFSNGDSSYICNFFPRADAISSFVANANSLLLITPLEVLSFSCG